MGGQVALEKETHRIPLDAQRGLDEYPHVPQMKAGHGQFAVGGYARPAFVRRPRPSNFPVHVLPQHLLELVRRHAFPQHFGAAQTPAIRQTQGLGDGPVPPTRAFHLRLERLLHPGHALRYYVIFRQDG